MDAPTDLTLYQSLGVAALLGLLVGLQRERVGKALGGLRTFALVTLLGAVCGVLARADGAGLGAWVVAAGLGAVAAVIVVSDLGLIRRGGFEPGMTTEMALVGMFLVGAVTTLHSMELGAALGGAVAILLYAKAPLQKIAGRLSEEDVRAIMQFVLITVIILPLLPDATYGPLGAINPRHLWLMVVLIVGIGLGAYIAQKFVDQRRGALVAGALGGLISSTATTVGAARMARQSRHSARAQATVIAVASAVVFIRVLIEIAAAAPQRFWDMAPPVGILLVVAALGALLVWSGVSKGPATPDEAGNPTRLTAALAFAALYAIMLLAVAWIQTTRLGDAGVYAVAALSGLTDMDAITLSVSRLAADGQMETGAAWRAIAIASVSNLVFKAGVVAWLGTRRALWWTLAPFGMIAVAAAALILLWPG